MSNAARKARKRAGIPYQPKPPKVPTPVEERSATQAEGRRMIRRVARALFSQLGAAPTDEQVKAELERLQREAEGASK